MDENIKKPVILSGVTPSGLLTIGHLAGAISNWVKLQNQYECYFMIADLHAITVKQIPAELRKRTLDTAALFIAAGIDPEKAILFIQSQVPEHAQLTWVLNTFTGMGECSRMTQFKDKSLQHSENVNVGLFDYPVLMASDILLYQANLVPVGEDQKQHLELSRNLAQRFNYYYSDTFTVPEPYISDIGARVMSLQEPTKKMSKSDDNLNSVIFLTDNDNDIKNKIKRAITDSGTEIKYSDDKPGIQNLMTFYHLATGKNYTEIEEIFDGKGYGEFKSAVGDAVADYIRPIRTRYNELINDKEQLKTILTKGAESAQRIAGRTLRKVYKKVGFVSF
jgi:tryptophanyl-tRNA synthetase